MNRISEIHETSPSLCAVPMAKILFINVLSQVSSNICSLSVLSYLFKVLPKINFRQSLTEFLNLKSVGSDNSNLEWRAQRITISIT